MSIAQQINDDIKKSMLAKDKARLEALRAIKSAILMIASEKAGSVVSDDDAMTAMQKLVKQRKDAAAIYEEQGREDMAEVEIFQADVISTYLPEMMGEEEVRKLVMDKIAASGASGPQDIGKVMGPLMGQLKGKADGKLISQLVKEELGKL
ncbi:MAG: GatB/YqeY domain-containing protein [Flavobacteriales bacterium]|nr:GatB/YqeY domain-containing protein [Flavobacteriales bacterium]